MVYPAEAVQKGYLLTSMKQITAYRHRGVDRIKRTAVFVYLNTIPPVFEG